MTDVRDPYALSDEDRLPWLEPVDDADQPERGGSGRLIGLAVAALVLLAVAIGGIWWWQNRTVAPSGTGELIAAPAGPYKVKPEDEGGMAIEGQGDMAFATSEGAQVKGALDLDAVPETPVERTPAPVVTPVPKAGASATVADGGQITAKAPPAPPAPEGPAGATIQLGAFPTAGNAAETWKSMSGRFAYLSTLDHSVIKAEVNGRTYHRLRVNAGSADQARDVCARLRVAGESCLVVN